MCLEDNPTLNTNNFNRSSGVNRLILYAILREGKGGMKMGMKMGMNQNDNINQSINTVCSILPAIKTHSDRLV